ncbi:MAG TPA: hypothetical protein VFR97_04050, partial [Capillimicrobium sp.]|nr:hypothetical protein [Capillimicrobium sp.]
MTVDLRGTVVTAAARKPPAAGYLVQASLVVEQRLAEGDGKETLRLATGGSARVGDDGAWAIRIDVEGDGSPVGSVDLTVSAPDGTTVLTRTLAAEQIAKPIPLKVAAVEVPAFEPAALPATGERPLLAGRVVDEAGRETPAHLAVAIWATTRGDDGDLRPVAVTETQPGGFFTALWPAEAFRRAEGRVNGLDPVPVRLDADGRLPRDLLLVLDLGELPDDAECSCHEAPPRAPEPADLVRNPAAF